jgi:hypothetical protein
MDSGKTKFPEDADACRRLSAQVARREFLCGRTGRVALADGPLYFVAAQAEWR